uniref:Uncharacterized protein n=1 Tax=Oryzias latipes TaxID=8090 RepID=A0A3P9M3V0_ORYLA
PQAPCILLFKQQHFPHADEHSWPKGLHRGRPQGQEAFVEMLCQMSLSAAPARSPSSHHLFYTQELDNILGIGLLIHTPGHSKKLGYNREEGDFP